MAINWFPGHMHKARKDINKVMSEIDLVIEVLDARIPFSSANPLIGKIKSDKPCIKVLNKADLADPVVTERWQQRFEQDASVKSLSLSANHDGRKQTIVSLCRKLAAKKANSDKAINAMIMGIPNVGKSTLINALAGKVIAKTGNEPAVTKRQQKIDLGNGIVLSDTPGILWPKLEPESCGFRLAATGAIKDTAMEYELVALFALNYLKQAYPDALQSRFKLDTTDLEAMSLLELIGRKRGCLRPGGVVDIYQASTILLQEIRSAKLGRISLETPEMMDNEMAEFRVMLEAKQIEKVEQEKHH